jgi:hypothetical protein
MSPAIQDLLISLVSSVITGFAVWSWGKFQLVQRINRKAKFFDIKPGDSCLIVVPKYRGTEATSHRDLETAIEALKLVYDIEAESKVLPVESTLESPGSVTEFCIAGPGSNERTKAHLDNYFDRVGMKPFSDGPESLAIVTKRKTYRLVGGEIEYAVLAKFFPYPNSKPVFIICGQTGIANKGALHYLAQSYDKLVKRGHPLDKFCLILKVQKPSQYGYKSVVLEEDITDTAFLK